MDALLEPFGYAFMQRALLEVVLMGLTCGLLGVFVVLRGLTYAAESLSHTLVPGAALAVAVSLPLLPLAFVSALAAVCLLAGFLQRPDVGAETAVGVAFTGIFAAGVMLLSVRGSTRDLDSVLFGSILAVDRDDLRLGIAATAAVLALGLGFSRRFVLVAFDRSFARAVRVGPLVLDVVLLAGLALALTVALRGMGTLLVLSLVVAPAATARVWTRSVWRMLWLAPTVAISAGLVGLELSYHADVAAGAAIALTAVGAFAASSIAAAARLRLARREAAAT